MNTNNVPTRATHADEARRALPTLQEGAFWQAASAAWVEEQVQRRSPERHAARIESAREACAEVAARLLPSEPPGPATSAIALLVLVGQGGCGDLGGPGCMSALPLLPLERRWRHKAGCGGAWTAALSAVATHSSLRVRVDSGGDGWEVAMISHTDDRVSIVSADVCGAPLELLHAVRRAIAPGARWVTGDEVGVCVEGIDDTGVMLREVALAGVRAAIAELIRDAEAEVSDVA